MMASHSRESLIRAEAKPDSGHMCYVGTELALESAIAPLYRHRTLSILDSLIASANRAIAQQGFWQ